MIKLARSLALVLMALAALVGTVGSPAHAAYPTSKNLTVAADDQDTYYYCGPASVRNALSARGIYTVQSNLARELGTTVDGTNSIADVTRVLNAHVGTGWYENKWISGSTATQAQINLLKSDMLLDINNNYVIVANILGTATDTAGHSHTYSGGHYLDVVGYSSSGDVARIYDVANNTFYNMTTARLATWIAERGYSA